MFVKRRRALSRMTAVKPKGPPGVPPKGWSSPAIRFWKNHLRRPFPPSSIRDGDANLKKWSPLLQGLEDLPFDGTSIRRRTAEVLEFEASLLREFSSADPANDEMAKFGRYIKENEMGWFLVAQEDFREAMARAEEPNGFGVFLKFYFPTIRRRCNTDALTRITELIFEE
jgi:hypothetical protein